MPDVPIQPEPEPTRREDFYQALWGFGGAVDHQTRRAVTGDERGALRRPALFLIASIGIIVLLAGVDGVGGLVAGTLALIALLLLAMTDQVVSL